MRCSTESSQELNLSPCGSISMSLIVGNKKFNRRRYSLSDLSANDNALKQSKKDSYRFICMSLLTSTMMIAEIITGIFTGSLTLLSDALHMLSDLIALMIGFAAHRMSNGSRKQNSSQHTIVIMRYEIVGALINGTILLTSCFIMSLEATKRALFLDEGIENVDYVLYVGAAGLFINVIGLCVFGHHGHSHGHSHEQNSHDHSHGHSHKQKHSQEHSHEETHDTNLNIRAVFLHILGDLLGSIAVIISALVIKFTDGWWNYYIDSICTQFIVILISISACRLIKESGNILLDKSPFDVDINNKIKKKLSEIKGVLNVHELHCWQIKSGYYIASVHLVIDSNWNDKNTNDKMGIIDKCKVILHKYGIHSSIVQPEFAKKGDNDWKKSNYPCFDYICNKNDCIKKSKALSFSK